MYITVDAKPGDLVITDSGFIGTVTKIIADGAGVMYEVIGFEKDGRGRPSAICTNQVFTQTYEYRSYREKQVQESCKGMMNTAQKICDKFLSLRDGGEATES